MAETAIVRRQDMTPDERALNDWIRAYCLGVLAARERAS